MHALIDSLSTDHVIEFASTLAEGTTVHVSALSFISNADIVTLQPLSSADYDLIEASANWFESSALLSQVSVVYEGQELTLTDDFFNTIRVRVKLEDTATRPQLWPTTASSSGTCTRLVADTRVVVEKPPSVAARKYRVLSLYDGSIQQALANHHRDSTRSLNLFVEPGCALVNDRMASMIVCQSETSATVLHCQVSKDVPEDCIGTFLALLSRDRITVFRSTGRSTSLFYRLFAFL